MRGKRWLVLALTAFMLSVGLIAGPQFAGAATPTPKATSTPKSGATTAAAAQTLTKDTVEAGKTVTIKVTGFAANETVTVRLYNGKVAVSVAATPKATKTPKATATPKAGATAKATSTAAAADYAEIATFTVDATGAGSKSITIPAKTTAGVHGIGVYGKSVSTTGTITVTAAGGAATTVPAATVKAGATTAANGTDSSNTDPTNATAKCKDGTYSHSKTASGTCANHGGVDTWINKPAA